MKEAFYVQLSTEMFAALKPGTMLHHISSGVTLLVLSEYMQTDQPVASRIMKVLDDNGATAICGVEIGIPYDSPWELLQWQ